MYKYPLPPPSVPPTFYLLFGGRKQNFKEFKTKMYSLYLQFKQQKNIPVYDSVPHFLP